MSVEWFWRVEMERDEPAAEVSGEALCLEEMRVLRRWHNIANFHCSLTVYYLACSGESI